MWGKRVYILARGYCHKIRSLVIDLYEYDLDVNQKKFIKKIVLCKNETKQDCLGMFHSSISCCGQYVHYCQIVNEGTKTTFTLKTIDLLHPESEDQVTETHVEEIDQGKKTYISAIFVKRFYSLSEDNSAMDPNLKQRFNFLSLFYFCE